MNLIQIANGMGDHMTFGDLPQYGLVIKKINEILPEEDNITVQTTGTAFLEIYDKLKQSTQNELAIVLDDSTSLKLDIVTDIAFSEVARRRRDQRIFTSNARLFVIIAFIAIIGNIYCAFTYHQLATKIIGSQYDSSMLGAVKYVFKLYDQITTLDNSTEP
jgi:hypothetical protein